MISARTEEGVLPRLGKENFNYIGNAKVEFVPLICII